MDRLEFYKLRHRVKCYGWQYMPTHTDSTLHNIYHATVQKAGSLWVRRIFIDKRIRKFTRLSTFPTHRYTEGEFYKTFPKYSFVSGLYMSYDLYEEIKKPSKYKTLYVLRDPRDIVVSWYYSMLQTHMLMPKVADYRSNLQRMGYNEGIDYAIKTLAIKFAGMRTWMYNQHDPHVLIIKFEELTQNPIEGFKRIFQHCGFDIPQAVLHEVLADYTKDKMRERDLANRIDKSESHYRYEKSTYQTGFTDQHVELFNAINGDLLTTLGYA